jgi:hypothetical protein
MLDKGNNFQDMLIINLVSGHTSSEEAFFLKKKASNWLK